MWDFVWYVVLFDVITFQANQDGEFLRERSFFLWWPAINNYSDAIMSSMASQIAGVLIVCSTVCSGADQWKYQSSVLLPFVRGVKTYIYIFFGENVIREFIQSFMIWDAYILREWNITQWPIIRDKLTLTSRYFNTMSACNLASALSNVKKRRCRCQLLTRMSVICGIWLRTQTTSLIVVLVGY